MVENPVVPGVGEADQQQSDSDNHGANNRRFSPELDRHRPRCSLETDCRVVWGLVNLSYVQGDPSGQPLYFVDFDLGVTHCCLHGMPILQLPKQNKADMGTKYQSKSTKCSRRLDRSP